MASKKPVPLKDEQIYPADEILQHIEQLSVAVTNLANEQQTIIKEFEALSRKNADTVSAEVREVINELLEKYLLNVKKVETDHDDTI